MTIHRLLTGFRCALDRLWTWLKRVCCQVKRRFKLNSAPYEGAQQDSGRGGPK